MWDAAVWDAAGCSSPFVLSIADTSLMLSVDLVFTTGLLLQTKGYAEGAGDSLAGGLKKNVAKVTGNDAKQAEGKVNQRSSCTCCCVALIGVPALIGMLWVQVLTALRMASAASAHLTGYYLLQGRPGKPKVMPRRRSTSRVGLTNVTSSLPRLFVVWCKAVTETTTMMLIQAA